MPLGGNILTEHGEMTLTIYKDYLLVEESPKVVEEGSREKIYNHFTNYEP